jgi:hypothetical protein
MMFQCLGQAMAIIFLETTAKTHFDSLCTNQVHYGA